MELDSFNQIVQVFDNTFGVPDDWETLVKLRVNLILEEVGEFQQELLRDPSSFTSGVRSKELVKMDRVAKELADVLFVVLGAFDTMDLDLEAALEQVGTKNWNKIQNKGLMTMVDGKVTKPKDDPRFV